MAETPKSVREFLAAAGRKGGVARRKRLTSEQRRKIARKAARARWRKPSAP